MKNIDNITPENRDSENGDKNSSKISFGVETNEKGEKESFTKINEDKDSSEKDGSDDDKKNKKDSFKSGLQDKMREEMDESKGNGGKEIVVMIISINISDIKSAAEGSGSGKVKAEKLTIYRDATFKNEDIEVDMSKEQAQEVMGEIKDKSLKDNIRDLLGLSRKNGDEAGKNGDEAGKNGDEVNEQVQKAIDSMEDLVLEEVEKNDDVSDPQDLKFEDKIKKAPNEVVTR